MITPKCDVCDKELDDYGAILLSPPKGHDVKKYHICKACYDKVSESFNLPP